jgi:hypothetical protein
VEVTVTVKSHEILAVLQVWEGNVASAFGWQGIVHHEFIPEGAVIKKERHKRRAHFSAGCSLPEVFQNAGSIDWVLLHSI